MGLLLLILSTTAIVFLDKKIYGTFYTPSIILSVPFLVICILYDLNADLLGFTALNYDVLYIWVFGLFFFWITGVVTTVSMPVKRYIVSKEEKQKDIYFYGKNLTNFSFLLACILTI